MIRPEDLDCDGNLREPDPMDIIKGWAEWDRWREPVPVRDTSRDEEEE